MKTDIKTHTKLAYRGMRILGTLSLLAALFFMMTQPARADIPGCSNATGGVSGLGHGTAINGKIGSQDISVGFAGVIYVDLTGVANDIQVFCIDLTHKIGIGDCFNSGNALTGDVWKALYYYPPDNTLSDTENAARQAAVWHFSDNFVPTSPSDVVTLYDAIIIDINSQPDPPSSTPPVMSISPSNASLLAGQSVPFTLTVSQNGMPLSSAVTINLTTDFGTLSTPSVTTNNTASFSITSAQAGVAHITASFSYQLPVGTQFNATEPDKQKLVLGEVTSGTVVAPATVNWSAPTASTLNSFSAHGFKNNVKLVWETGSEVQVMGFNVWRSAKRDGKYNKVNAQIIPAKQLGQIGGAAYAFTDKTVKPGKTYFYKLEVSGGNGVLEWSNVEKVKLATK